MPPKSFAIYDALGVSKERAAEIAKRTLMAFRECDDDMQRLCEAVSVKYDPEAVLVGVVIEQVCSANDAVHGMDKKTTRRRRFN